MKEKFQDAIELIDNEGRLKKTVWGQFWSSHQRFFKYLCMACKVPRVVDLAQKALKNKKCVVIGLQSTGEARTIEQLDEFGEINDFISTARGVLQNLVEKHFPTVESLSNSSNSNVSGILSAEMKQILEAKKLKSKDSKNSQKVNDILNRLSSYTNTNSESAAKLNEAKRRLKLIKSKKKRRKSLRSSSVSSQSSLGSSFGSLSSSDLKSDLDNSENNSFDENVSQFESSFDEEEQEDDDDPFKIHETCNHDLEEFNDFSSVKNEPNDSGYSTNSYKPKNESLKFENLFEMPSLTSDPKDTNAFESDDSDSLFSITKSVSVQSLMNRNNVGNNRTGMNVSNVTGAERKRNSNRVAGEKSNRKRKKKIQSKQNCLFGNDEDEEDDDDDLDEKNIMNDDDLNCILIFNFY